MGRGRGSWFKWAVGAGLVLTLVQACTSDEGSADPASGGHTAGASPSAGASDHAGSGGEAGSSAGNVATFAEVAKEECLLRAPSAQENELLPLAVTRFSESGVRRGTRILRPDADAAEQVAFALAAREGELARAPLAMSHRQSPAIVPLRGKRRTRSVSAGLSPRNPRLLRRLASAAGRRIPCPQLICAATSASSARARALEPSARRARSRTRCPRPWGWYECDRYPAQNSLAT